MNIGRSEEKCRGLLVRAFGVFRGPHFIGRHLTI